MSIHHDLLKLIFLYLKTLIDQYMHIWEKKRFLRTNLTNLPNFNIVIHTKLRRKYQLLIYSQELTCWLEALAEVS